MTKAVKPTISHVLKAVQHLSTSVDGRFTETHEAILSLAEMTERRFDHIEAAWVIWNLAWSPRITSWFQTFNATSW